MLVIVVGGGGDGDSGVSDGGNGDSGVNGRVGVGDSNGCAAGVTVVVMVADSGRPGMVIIGSSQ